LALTVVAAASLAAAASAADVPVPVVEAGFVTPSGNIACNAGHQYRTSRALLSCTVFSLARPSRGQRIWSLFVRGRPLVGWIVGNAATDLPTLGYGRQWAWRGFRCMSARRGLTCRNRSGHGFFLSRQSQRLF
jgi:hypothetical protein